MSDKAYDMRLFYVSLLASMLYSKFLSHFFSAGLEKKVRELHKTVVALEEEKYDWESKIRKQVMIPRMQQCNNP